ncbi:MULTISPECIES: hypothetical protein [unclassified Rhodococcus (in: high G+C Gram-positive bacteria)]|uniref:hypothetical protein n=1 Tax=unclassified Rhodococcus (in: high G+C Gram-positive bacteria) TaxID=192944 RepID=UPI0013578BBE|nr:MULTISPECIES: hypothetical protein [unclassified Rhodococcus (in: high G+C Gram-positive bacteria)]
MSTKTARQVKIAAGRLSLGLGAVLCTAVLAAAPAMAAPWMPHAPNNVPRSEWVDCGPKICTKYYSIEATAAIAEYASQGYVDAVQAWPDSIEHFFFGNAIEDTQAMEDNAVEASVYGGCVQVAQRADKKGPKAVSWTNHPRYCGSEKARYEYVDSGSEIG